jgi:serine phosphatase RsbU (regulator of sigma subunit)/anti-sigma regulatory factor (Ser/Thr protein kinase)
MVVGSEPERDEQVLAEDHLRRVQTLTDATLAYLSIDELLGELLDRIRDLLHADTAAILLLDPTGRELVATAAKGIEEEVAQGVRIPLGAGFAGRIAASGEPLFLPEVDHTNVLNPLLREKGIRSLLGAPLVCDGRTMGVVHVGTLVPRVFGQDEVELLQMVGDRAAVSISARLSGQERMVTATLQRSLLPGRMPAVQGAVFGTRYVPGEMGLGGDWYDVLPLSGTRVGVVIGDVVGHGLQASVVMGRFRSALRAYAIDAPTPGDALSRLNAMVRSLEPREMATVLYGVFDRSTGLFEYSTAGHPPPVLARPGEDAELLEVFTDPPIGATEIVTRRNHTLEIPVGATLYLYTDGVVERRGHSIDEGLEALRAAAQAGPPELGCARIAQRLVGDTPPEDDFAVLAMHRADEGDRLEVVVPAIPASLARVRLELRRWLRARHVPDDAAFDLVLAAGEASANAVEHAYGGIEGDITIGASNEGSVISISVTDSGRWREPRGEGRGRGLHMMRTLVDDVQVEWRDHGTRVTLLRDVGPREPR